MQKRKNDTLQQQAEAEATYTALLTNIATLGATLPKPAIGPPENQTAPTGQDTHQVITQQIALHLQTQLDTMDYDGIAQTVLEGTD